MPYAPSRKVTKIVRGAVAPPKIDIFAQKKHPDDEPTSRPVHKSWHQSLNHRVPPIGKSGGECTHHFMNSIG